MGWSSALSEVLPHVVKTEKKLLMGEIGSAPIAQEHGATVVISHRIRHDAHAAYEDWLTAIGPVCRSFPGHLDWQIIRPITGLSGTYTVVIRFDTQAHLENWMFSEERKGFVAKVRTLLEADDQFHITTGLDFWFAPEGATKVPYRWKQALVTWSAIYPLVLIVPLVLLPLFQWIGLPDHPLFVNLLGSGVIVVLMAYVVMPHYTKLIKGWLYS